MVFVGYTATHPQLKSVCVKGGSPTPRGQVSHIHAARLVFDAATIQYLYSALNPRSAVLEEGEDVADHVSYSNSSRNKRRCLRCHHRSNGSSCRDQVGNTG